MKKISVLFISLILVLTLTACGTSETAEEAVNNAFTAVKKSDSKTIEKYFGQGINFEGVDEERASQEIQALHDNLEFEVLLSDEKNGVVKTAFTNIDMLPVMVKTFEKALELSFSGLSEEELEKESETIVRDILQEDNLEKLRTNVDLQLKKENKEWKIKLDDELMNAMFGNFQAILDDLNNSGA